MKKSRCEIISNTNLTCFKFCIQSNKIDTVDVECEVCTYLFVDLTKIRLLKHQKSEEVYDLFLY